MMATSSGKLTLRPPTIGELSALSELCLISKAWWGYDRVFLNACREEMTIRPVELASTSVVVAEHETHRVGVAQIMAEGPHIDLLKLFVDPNHMRRGHGAVLFNWAVREGRRLGAKRMTIQSDPGAETFYRRMGACRIGNAPSDSIPGRSLPLFEISLTQA
jgi:GNAT superfamily N-acetyltransferase